MRRGPLALLCALIVLTLATPHAAAAPEEGCYLRSGDAQLPAGHLGIKRSRLQIYDVDIRLVTEGGSECRVSGVARRRGVAGQEVLAFPLRQPGAEACQVLVTTGPQSIVLTTPGQACAARPPCGALIALDGLRFERSAKVADAASAPCFAR